MSTKRFTRLAGAAMIAVGMLVGAAWAQEWNCGATDNEGGAESVKCVLGEDGIFTVSGAGAMRDYSGNSPWYSNRASITAVVIGDSVTSIGEQAFQVCTNLASVTIGDSVTSIGGSAFYNCTGLESITIPNSVESIGGSAFYGCTSLKSITIPSGVTSIGSRAFSGCTNLTTINYNATNATTFGTDSNHWLYGAGRSGPVTANIGDNVTNIPANLFYVEFESNRPNITTISLGSAVKTIGASAFSNLTGLESITIPNSVTSIGDRAFSGCTSLESITIGNSVESIGGSAFSGCTGLMSITIPDGVTSIGNYAFSGCTNLTTITSLNPIPPTVGSQAFGYAARLYVPEDNVLDYRATSEWSRFTIVNDLLRWVSGSTLVTLGDDSTLTVSGAGAMANYNSSGNTAPWYSERASITAVVIGDSVTSIGSYAFYNCTGLTSITIPNSVDSIGSGAFHNCASLESITSLNPVPPTVGIGPFTYAPTTARLYVPEDNVFAYMRATEWRRFTNINDLLWWASDSTLVTLADDGTLTVSGSGAMANYTYTGIYGSTAPWYSESERITTVIIGDSVTSIGGNAFRNCTNLTSVTIGNGVTSIGEYAFLDCTSLESITIPNNMDSIGRSAFSGCTGLKSVTIGDSVTSIGDYAFYGCTGLTSITSLRPTPPTVVGSYVFYNVPTTACLSVPEASIAAYSSADGWRRFTCIQAASGPVSVFTPDRVLPVPPTEDAAVVAPVNSAASGFTAGPNIIRRGDGAVKIYRVGGTLVTSGTLTVYDATGNVVNKISISDNASVSTLSPASPANGRREVGRWNLRDAKGRAVAEGAYLLRGVVRTADGKREKVSLPVSVR